MMTPMQIQAMQDSSGSQLAHDELLLTLKIVTRGTRGFWQCEISVKPANDEFKFSERPNLPVAQWSEERRSSVESEAAACLEGVGEGRDHIEELPDVYIVRRDLTDIERIELASQRGL